MLRVLFISRPTLFSTPGGDSVQMTKTKEYLEKQYEIKVDIWTGDKHINYEQYDLIHFFNLIRPNNILNHLDSGLPYVISPIYVDYSEFEKKHRGGKLQFLAQNLSKGNIEYLKSLARWLKNGEYPGSLSYILKGYNRSIQKILQHCSVLLPNSQSELKRIEKEFNIPCRSIIVPNAIESSLFEGNPNEDKRGVLCVARIEGMKNQLNLIKAIKQTDLQLSIIGKASPNHQGYYEACKREANEQITFIDQLSQKELVEYYKKASVHAMVSFFETTGLSSLEAAACGCNIVISNKGDQQEYFKDDVFYANPADVNSIKDALLAASAAEANTALIERISKDYQWNITADRTMEAYRLCLKIRV